MRRCLVILLLILGFVTPAVTSVVAQDTQATPTVDISATPDSCECGPPPMCSDMPGGVPDVDCIPDLGPKPEPGGIHSENSDGAQHCESGMVEIIITTYIITDYSPGSDNEWHYVLGEGDGGVVEGTRPMTDVELAQCEPVIPPTEIVEPPTEPVDSEEVEDVTDDQLVVVTASTEGDGTGGSTIVPSPATRIGMAMANAAVHAAKAAMR